MCLFMRRLECWNDGMILSKIVVPLAYYWLANFEDWLFSGVWRGGGTHPVDPEVPASLPIFPGEDLVIVPASDAVAYPSPALPVSA